MQAITRFFIERWQFTLIVFVMLFALGLANVQAIPKSEDPIVKFAGVGVFVVLPGADPEQMERVVAIPIETALNGLEYVDTISSNSSAGLASISVQFEYGVDPEKKYDEVVRELNVIRQVQNVASDVFVPDRANPEGSEGQIQDTANPSRKAAGGARRGYFFLLRSGTTVTRVGVTAIGEMGLDGLLSFLGFLVSLLLRCSPLAMAGS